MASIFKQQYTTKDPKTGERIKKKSAHWYIDYKGPDGIRKRIKGFKDKTATVQLAAKLEREAEQAESGIIDRFKEHIIRPLTEHLTEWCDSLISCGITEKQANQNYNRAFRIFTESGFCFWQDISASKTIQTINRLQTLVRRKNKKNGKIEMQKTGFASSITKRHHLRAVKQFTKWMIVDGRAPLNPLEHLTLAARVENPKRALSVAEIQVLLEYTNTAGTSYNISGPERALICRLAIETGLRAEEINSLKRPSFDFEARTVWLDGKCTKNRKPALLPLRAVTMEQKKIICLQKCQMQGPLGYPAEEGTVMLVGCSRGI